MKIALDNHVSFIIAKRLEKRKFEIVYHAQDESDEWWLNAALENGAICFISKDLDVQNFAFNRGLQCILLPGSIKKDKIYDFIKRRLRLNK